MKSTLEKLPSVIMTGNLQNIAAFFTSLVHHTHKGILNSEFISEEGGDGGINIMNYVLICVILNLSRNIMTN